MLKTVNVTSNGRTTSYLGKGRRGLVSWKGRPVSLGLWAYIERTCVSLYYVTSFMEIVFPLILTGTKIITSTLPFVLTMKLWSLTTNITGMNSVGNILFGIYLLFEFWGIFLSVLCVLFIQQWREYKISQWK